MTAADSPETPVNIPGDGSTEREINYRHSDAFFPILDQLNVSLLVSTYQAGKLIVLGTHAGQPALSFHNFDQPMGIAVRDDRLAVGAKRQVWFLNSAPEIAAQLKPAGKYEGCFLTRASCVTGEIDGHEMAWESRQLWIVNTLFSCLCTLDDLHSFVPRWQPPFVSALAAEDRCHLNGLATDQGQPRYVSVLGETDTKGGWRPNKAIGGAVIDVLTNETVVRGLAMPHSPRLVDGRLWVLNSGHGQLSIIDPGAGTVEPVESLPGYTRGLAFAGPFAFVGLSKIRETSTFGGLPIAEQRDQLKCGIGIVDSRTGRSVASFEFASGVDEIFAVQVVPGIKLPAISGPFPDIDGTPPIWMVPAPRSMT